MEYCTPNELAEQYWKSLKTIYNRLQKHADKIRTKKEFWKTIVNCNDFERLFQNYKINYKKVTKPKVQVIEKEVDKEEKTLWKDFVNLQNDYNINLQRIQNLEKHNSTLSTQLKEYALLFKEEKKEKHKSLKHSVFRTQKKLIDWCELQTKVKRRF